MGRLIATLAVIVLVSSGAFAQDLGQEERKHGLADTATVVRTDPAGKILTVRNDASGGEMEIAIDQSTRVMRDADQIPLSGLEPGDRVVISARREGAVPSERPIADLVQLVIDDPGAGAASPHVSAKGAASTEGRAKLRGADGKELGEIRFRETPAGLLIEASLSGLPPGRHGFHVHAVGRCEPPFESAGDHLAPHGRSHGFLVQEGPHGGDLVNLEVGPDGRVQQELRAPALKTADLLDADGSAFLVHEQADDYSSPPSGASGARIACAAVGGAVVAAPER